MALKPPNLFDAGLPAAGLRFDPHRRHRRWGCRPGRLHDAGADVLLLEANDRLGTRARIWIGDPHRALTASYRLSPSGSPLMEAFHGGLAAEALDEVDACAFAIDELAGLLGNDWPGRLKPLARTRWRHEPWIGGSYSYARAGGAGRRATLAEPVHGRIFFAGEACCPCDFTTAHGACQTGVAAADAVLADG